jgi:hypothetical protein
MLNTRSGAGQDIPPVIRAHIASQLNQVPPPPQELAMDPMMQQFFTAQMQLIQNLITSVQNLQAQQNQPPPQGPPPPPPPVNKHREFMSHNSPTYSHLVDPLDVDDWLKNINKMLNITQCNDCGKVLYASGRLEGATSNWWDAYTVAHSAADTIAWQEFQESFHTHHILAGVKKLKQKEFLTLKQGNMTVSVTPQVFNYRH